MRVFWVRRNLAFGSAITTWRDVEQLREQGISHVINLRKNRNGKKIKEFDYLWLPFRDDKKERPKWFYRAALKFHQRSMRHKRSKLFVMCHHGRCRSASLTFFLLRAGGTSPRAARSLVLAARPTAQIVRTYRVSGERYLLRQGI